MWFSHIGRRSTEAVWLMVCFTNCFAFFTIFSSVAWVWLILTYPSILNSTSHGNGYSWNNVVTELLCVIIGAGSNPLWNESFLFTVSDSVSELNLRLMDKDSFTKDDFLGEAKWVKIPLYQHVNYMDIYYCFLFTVIWSLTKFLIYCLQDLFYKTRFKN